MQHEEANKIRKEWGDKPCNHPHTEKEYYLGTDTGDKVCTQCGQPVYFHTDKKIQDDSSK